MQTFMTRPRFGATGADLDNSRLGKQMTEAMQIFDHLTGVAPNFYPNHPIMGMWRGYEYALGIYAMMLNLEWTFKRGYAEHKALKWFYNNIQDMRKDDPEFSYQAPPWLRDSAVLKSHRSNLIRKDQQYYGNKWKVAPDNWPYLWPVVDDEGGYVLKISRADRDRVRRGERNAPDKATIERIVNW